MCHSDSEHSLFFDLVHAARALYSENGYLAMIISDITKTKVDWNRENVFLFLHTPKISSGFGKCCYSGIVEHVELLICTKQMSLDLLIKTSHLSLYNLDTSREVARLLVTD